MPIGPNDNPHPKAPFILAAAKTMSARILEPITRDMLIKHLAATSHGSKLQFTIKDAFEMLECALIGHLQSSSASADELLSSMIEAYSTLPTHTVRSELQVNRQQFSTPAPLALFAQTRANINQADFVLEPSAGTGLLATAAARMKASIHLNELDSYRRSLITGLYSSATVTNMDAAEIGSRWKGRAPTIVLMNPPFSRNADGYEDSFTALRHLHSALKILTPGGRLVAILPNWIDRAGRNADSLKKMTTGASIVERFALAKGCFAKHGTSIATTLLVLENIPDLPMRNNFDIGSLSELPNQPKPLKRQQLQAPTPKKLNSKSIFNGFSKPTKPVQPPQSQKTANDDIMPVTYKSLDEPAPLGEQVGEYVPYRPARMIFDIAGEHPSELVESITMGSVAPPKPHYRPLLPTRIVKDGVLSAAQLETVVYAGQAHSEWLAGSSTDESSVEIAEQRIRKGYFLGDGTGAGKGRQIAAIILDNWLQGRRQHIWISQNATLIEDARRDWTAVGGIGADIQPLNNWKIGKNIDLNQGILFLPFATLRSQREDDSRLAQILTWLDEDFDGVIAFDEAHAMGGVAGGETSRGKTKGSEQGIAGVTLQDKTPSSRVLYASATGASNVNNLAYAVRLGLWGPSTQFPTREMFIEEIAAGGIAAMEVVARDLKSMGLYTARALSFSGVEYEILEHELSAEQIETYDSYAEAWSIIHQNMKAALEASSVVDPVSGETLNAGAKGAARSRFESVKMRFFQQLLMSMKLPSLFPAMDNHIEEGQAIVIQLVSTGEAMLNRRLDELDQEGGDELDIDLSPREYLFDYLTRAFPTRQMQTYVDLEGNLRSQPMIDEAGNAVHCAEALARRESCLEQLGAMPPISSALDAIITRFGEDEVAEITGRSRRLSTAKDGQQIVQRRSARSNAAETDAFMEDRKRILIFSDAGGTGRSYHASLDVPNQRRRVHFLLEPGWRAAAAIQGLGRTHRTYQASSPLFRPVTTNCRGERRFISTIARRLDTLGALTRGQRQTGGQNLFDPADNLESDYAKSALVAWFSLLYSGKLQSATFQEFQKRTGLELEGDDGELRMNLPPIQRWLNRILALPISTQNAVFDEFMGLVEQRVAKAREAGTLDLGVETISVETLDIVSERLLRTDRGGATTKLAELSITRKRRVRAADDIKAEIEWRKQWHQRATRMINEKSGKVALMVSQRDSLLDDGTTIRRFKLIRPTRTEHIEEQALSESSWRTVETPEFEKLWTAEADEARNTPVDDTLFIATGLLLPVWRKIPSRMLSVVRIAAADGRSILGRVVEAGDLGTLCKDLGLDIPNLTPNAMIESARGGSRIPVNGLDDLTLKTSRVGGAPRLEIIGAHAARLEWYKARGCYSEIIAYKTRLFLPDTEAPSILQAITEASTKELSSA